VNDPADGLPTKEMYEKLLEELLAVFSEIGVISCPQWDGMCRNRKYVFGNVRGDCKDDMGLG
jgi:hypothetical protein